MFTMSRVTIIVLVVAGCSSTLASPPAPRDPVLIGALNYGLDDGTLNYQPPPTVAQILQALLRAVSDWLSDIIKQMLQITSVELIKSINTTLVATKSLINRVIQDLEAIIPQVNAAAQANLRKIIDELLEPAVEAIEPILEQLREIMFYLPEALVETNLLSVSEIIEAILGMTLEEFLVSIKTIVTNFNTFLVDSISLVQQIMAQVPPEMAAQIEENVLVVLESVHRDILPILNGLGLLPIR